MKKRFLALGISSLMLFASGFSSIQAEGASCENWSDFPAFTYAKVNVSKTFFKDDNQVNRKAFLVKGDIVALRNEKPYGACAVFIGKSGIETIGWLETKALSAIQLTPKFAGTWAWQKPDSKAKLVISGRGSSFSVKGSASMPSGAGSVDVADLVGKAILEHNALLFKQDQCSFSALWLNGFLSVVDNSNCGGVMVRFTGVFKRVK